jgi:hypothetical protein
MFSPASSSVIERAILILVWCILLRLLSIRKRNTFVRNCICRIICTTTTTTTTTSIDTSNTTNTVANKGVSFSYWIERALSMWNQLRYDSGKCVTRYACRVEKSPFGALGRNLKNDFFYFWILHPVACIIRIVGNTVPATISVVVRFIISHCRYMFRSFYYLQAEYTIFGFRKLLD